MRFTVILAIAAILTPAALSARPAAPQAGTSVSTDWSAAKAKKKKAPAKKKEEYLKAAPGTGPSGPAKQ
jgi:hypothetical protein